MDEPRTHLTFTFEPLTVQEDGLYLPAVRMVDPLAGESTKVYQISLENEKMALAMARDFADQERQRCERSMQAILASMKR